MNDLQPVNICFQSILGFWFNEPAKSKWFNSTSEFDTEIFYNHHSTWLLASKNKLDHWQETAEGCLALAIVLDQFPLNMFRGTAKSFSTEKQAIDISRSAISNRFDNQLNSTQLSFLYMPFMHSEDLVDQNYSVKLFEQAGLKNNIRFAKHHRDIIKKYGRFPHRNKILGRTSTTEELEYLASPQAFKG